MKKILYILILPIIFSCNTENKWKQYIINNSDKVYKNDFGVYKIDSIKGYYTDLTIRLDSSGHYSVIVWGDRESYLWNLKKDYSFSTDVKYNFYKGLNIDKDIELIKSIKNK